jgi:hypothetical protein
MSFDSLADRPRSSYEQEDGCGRYDDEANHERRNTAAVATTRRVIASLQP